MESKNFIKKYLNIISPCKKEFIISYFVLLCELVFQRIIPLLLSKVVNSAVYINDMTVFIKYSFIYILIFVLFQMTSYIQLQIWQRTDNRFVFDIKLNCYNKIIKSTAFRLSNLKTGDAINLLDNDTAEMHNIIQRYAMRVINAVLGALISLLIIASIKWEISIVVIIVLPIIIFFTKKIEKIMKKLTVKTRDEIGNYLSWITEILENCREIKFFAAENNVSKLFNKKNRVLINYQNKQKALLVLDEKIIELITFLAQLAFYIVCAFFVSKKYINIGEYVALSSYYSMIIVDCKKIFGSKMEYTQRKTSAERVLKQLNEVSEDVYDNKCNDFCVDCNSVITYNNIDFGYEENNLVLKNLSMQINNGEFVAIVGKSGSGKSTLASLLLKLYPPQRGDIFIGKQNLKFCNRKTVRDSIGIVTQEAIIFDATIRDNITLFRTCNDDKIWDVLEKTNLDDEIKKLPNKLDTVVGDNGVDLSGGQKQRLCIARILYRDPPILIFDEVTSAVDHNNAEIIINTILKYKHKKTIIQITHRTEGLEDTDRIIVLKEGEIVGNGEYSSLFGDNKEFNSIFNN